MNKIIKRYTLLIAFLLIAIIGTLVYGNYSKEKTGGRSSSQSAILSGSWENTNATTTDPTRVATSTDSSLGDATLLSGTSTLIISLTNSDNIFINGFTLASGTSATNIHMTFDYTYDDIASTTGWYRGYEDTTSGSLRTWTATEEILTLPTNVASTSHYWLVNVPTYRAKELKISYSQSGSATTDIPYVLLDVNHK